MFLNNLYTVHSIEGSDQGVSVQIKINPGHVLYEGHFPGSPVTPGVVQLQIIKEVLENHFGKKMKMLQMRTCKFLQIINPQVTPEVTIDVKFALSEVLEVTTSIRHDETVYLKAQLIYTFV
jgi:3-hydroxyacyl-[acyl-carrier-protein] dehydratase